MPCAAPWEETPGKVLLHTTETIKYIVSDATAGMYDEARKGEKGWGGVGMT